MNYITVDRGKKITGHYCGDPKGISVKANERLVEVPDAQNEVVIGFYEDEYTPGWKLRPLKDRIADGSARWVPDDMILADNEQELRFKTRLELIQEGKEQLLPHEKIENGQVVEKTPEEKLADKLISQAEYDKIKQQERDDWIRGGINRKMPDWLVQGLTWEQMQAEVQKIVDSYPGK